MQKRHTDRARYFEEQSHTSGKHYIPYILKHTDTEPQNVLEVGCGEGGNLLPFALKNCKVVGVDISVSRISQAIEYFQNRNIEAEFIASNIFDLKQYYHRFDLIFVHDVIEHIHDKKQFLGDLQQFLAPGGFLFMAFPAWQMPFGGHQQIATSKVVSHLPFTHLLPRGIYKSFLKLFGENTSTVEELLSIKETRCTIEKFRKVAQQTNYEIINQQLFFINPHYEIKFGLSPRKLNKLISEIPVIRNFVCSGCFYILKPSTKRELPE